MTLTELDHIAGTLKQHSLICGSVAYAPLGTRAPRQGRDGAPLVSIITVTYNAADMLEAAIRSVAAQTYGEIEYIIVDGGSTDDTLQIVRDNAAHVDCLISEPDLGIYDAMNKGLLRARGTYVALLNADDQLYPDFVTESVKVLTRTGADISYCDYTTEDGPVHVGEIDHGLLLSQLGIKHNTFVMHRSCFERLGGFDAHLKVVADAKWNRAAWAAGLRFEKVPGLHVFYSLRGLSAGSTPAGKDRIIRESTNLVLDCFPALDRDQARVLYLSNFNTHEVDQVIALHRQLAPSSPVLGQMIQGAMRWNLMHRPGYRLRAQDADRMMQVIKLAHYLEVPLGALTFEDPETDAATDMAAFLGTIETARGRAAAREEKICLHFARNFSAPSETFIYDFLQDLAASDDGHVHVMLCDERQNAQTRPYDLTLTLPWQETGARLRTFLYDLIWDRLGPTRVVAHFALNGWWLHDRLRPDQRRVDWVNMCHGVDVFSLGDNADYSAYIDEYCAYADNVAFTAVSDFLAGLLAQAGVPDDRIFVVPNAVSDQFWPHRKHDGFWDDTRALRLLSIGRMIDWKGHDVLLRALAEVHERAPDTRIDLEIVYGRWDERLSELEALRDSLALPGSVRFVDYVDLRARSDYMPGFDLFVLPSTLSRDPVPRTETFGVAILEAIAAGLPVIGTDAGGIPEVIGTPTPQAMIVPHGEAGPLADAMLEMLRNKAAVFADNSAYARPRTDRFSAAARVRNWTRVTDWQARPRRKILHFCALGKGGAAQAALNIHKGFLRNGHASWFVTRASERGKLPAYTANVILIDPENSVDYNHAEPARRPEFTTFTLDDTVVSDETLRALAQDASLINLAWPAKFLSVRNIAMLTRLGIPVLMTLRDMNQITGGCHFFHGCTQLQQGCRSCPQLPAVAVEGFAHTVLAAKQACWNFDAVTFVALSDHTLDILEASPFGGRARQVKLPNYVETEVFYPDPTPLEDLPPAAPGVVRIGYLPSFGSRVKGHRELLAAMRYLRAHRADLRIEILLAANDRLAEEETPYPVVQIHAITERDRLRRFYNAVDMVAVPSQEETFSNTTLEALACGVPVVGFKTGVLQEILADGVCGTAADIGDVSALAEGIIRLADTPADPAVIRARVSRHYSRTSRMGAYEDMAHQIWADAKPPAPALDAAAERHLLELSTQQHKIKSDSIRGRLSRLNALYKKADKFVNGRPDDYMTLEEKLIVAEHHLNEIRSSSSWRITGPLRTLTQSCRALFRRATS